MNPAWYILASILGGLIVAVATLAGIRLGQGAEDRRLALSDQQLLREVKAERLRRIYEPLLKFGLLLQQVVHEKGYVMEREEGPACAPSPRSSPRSSWSGAPRTSGRPTMPPNGQSAAI